MNTVQRGLQPLLQLDAYAMEYEDTSITPAQVRAKKQRRRDLMNDLRRAAELPHPSLGETSPILAPK